MDVDAAVEQSVWHPIIAWSRIQGILLLPIPHMMIFNFLPLTIRTLCQGLVVAVMQGTLVLHDGQNPVPKVC